MLKLVSQLGIKLHVSGTELKTESRRKKISSEELGYRLGVTKNTVLRMFSARELDRRTVLACAQLGFDCARHTIDTLYEPRRVGRAGS